MPRCRPCDIRIITIGQNIEIRYFEKAGIPVEWGKIVIRNLEAFERGKKLYDLVFRITYRFSPTICTTVSSLIFFFLQSTHNFNRLRK